LESRKQANQIRASLDWLVKVGVNLQQEENHQNHGNKYAMKHSSRLVLFVVKNNSLLLDK